MPLRAELQVKLLQFEQCLTSTLLVLVFLTAPPAWYKKKKKTCLRFPYSSMCQERYVLIWGWQLRDRNQNGSCTLLSSSSIHQTVGRPWAPRTDRNSRGWEKKKFSALSWLFRNAVEIVKGLSAKDDFHMRDKRMRWPKQAPVKMAPLWLLSGTHLWLYLSD